MLKCLVCGAERDRERCHVITLTDDERAQVADPLDEYPYCKPCWGILSDPVAGPSLMSGIAQHYLIQAGVQEADGLATRYKQRLISRAVKRN